MITASPRQPYLPALFGVNDRASAIAAAGLTRAVEAVAAGLCEIIKAIGETPAGRSQSYILRDPRARTAHAVAAALSIGGQPRRLETFRLLLALASKAARERGTQGPAGALCFAALKLGQAILDPNMDGRGALEESTSAAITALAQLGDTDGQVQQLRAQGERCFLAQLRAASVH
jgi:hypothetical protein